MAEIAKALEPLYLLRVLTAEEKLEIKLWTKLSFHPMYDKEAFQVTHTNGPFQAIHFSQWQFKTELNV